MNGQQRELHYLLRTAQLDLEAGRPAERTAYAVETSLRVSRFTDMTDGIADDQEWRAKRGAGSSPRTDQTKEDR